MEKVIISQEQAKELEAFKALGRNLQDWYLGKYDDNFPDSILHALSVDQMAKALYIGYEIEPEKPKFKKGDLVFVDWNEGGDFQTVAGSDKKGVTIYADEGVTNTWPPIEIVRHATEEEKYWIRTLGREKVGDFREGDIVMTRGGIPYVVAKSRRCVDEITISDVKGRYEGGEFGGIYPAESFKPFPTDE